MLLFCGACYKRGGVRVAWTEHVQVKDHGPYSPPVNGQKNPNPNGIARKITATCSVCHNRDKDGYIIAVRKAG